MFAFVCIARQPGMRQSQQQSNTIAGGGTMCMVLYMWASRTSGHGVPVFQQSAPAPRCASCAAVACMWSCRSDGSARNVAPRPCCACCAYGGRLRDAGSAGCAACCACRASAAAGGVALPASASCAADGIVCVWLDAVCVRELSNTASVAGRAPGRLSNAAGAAKSPRGDIGEAPAVATAGKAASNASELLRRSVQCLVAEGLLALSLSGASNARPRLRMPAAAMRSVAHSQGAAGAGLRGAAEVFIGGGGACVQAFESTSCKACAPAGCWLEV